jgi:hypothetical protein
MLASPFFLFPFFRSERELKINLQEWTAKKLRHPPPQIDLEVTPKEKAAYLAMRRREG